MGNGYMLHVFMDSLCLSAIQTEDLYKAVAHAHVCMCVCVYL